MLQLRSSKDLGVELSHQFTSSLGLFVLEEVGPKDWIQVTQDVHGQAGH